MERLKVIFPSKKASVFKSEKDWENHLKNLLKVINSFLYFQSKCCQYSQSKSTHHQEYIGWATKEGQYGYYGSYGMKRVAGQFLITWIYSQIYDHKKNESHINWPEEAQNPNLVEGRLCCPPHELVYHEHKEMVGESLINLATGIHPLVQICCICSSLPICSLNQCIYFPLDSS